MDFRPLHDRVVVRRLDEDTKTAGGIIIPDTAQEKPQQGEVLAVGNGVKTDEGVLVPLDVKNFYCITLKYYEVAAKHFFWQVNYSCDKS